MSDSDQVKKAKASTGTGNNKKETIQKKGWEVRTADNQFKVLFQPIFKINNLPDAPNSMIVATDKDVECRYVDVKYRDKKSTEQELRFNFLDLFMFMYTCCNEELRQQLNLRYERQFTKIPYNVTFNLSKEEQTSGKATRLIELELDEVAMAMARAEARKLAGKDTQSYNEWFLKKKKVDISAIKVK